MKINTLLCFVLSAFTVIQAQNLLITEITDPQNSSTAGRYVEIYNPSSDDVDLSIGFALQRWTNGNTTPQPSVALTGTIPAGGFYIVCNDAAKFSATYGMEASQDVGSDGAADSNGDDIIALLGADGSIIDIYGEPGQDGSISSGGMSEFEDGRAERKCGTSASNIWISADWNMDHDSGGGDGNQSAPDDFDPFSWANDGVSCEVEVVVDDPCADVVCPEIYDPVCGDDGVTYSNSCLADCAVATFSTGECAEPVPGCTDTTATNYNSSATSDDGSCTYFSALTLKGVLDLHGVNGTTDGKGFHFVANADIPDLGVYSVDVVTNGAEADYDGPGADHVLSGSASAGDHILYHRVHSTSPTSFMSDYFSDCYAEFDLVLTSSSGDWPNGDDPVVFYHGNDAVDSLVGPQNISVDTDVDATIDGDPYDDSWAFNSDTGWVFGGKDCDRFDDTKLVYTSGCPYPLCPIVYGCTDTLATNYDSTAHVDDGLCNYPVDVVLGCTDSTAYNFNPDATLDNESCIAVVEGCTDSTATNYVYNANTDDGTCISVVYGCLDDNALNTDSLANTDDGSCEYPPLTNAVSLQGVLDLYGSETDYPNGNGNDGKAFHLKVHEDVPNLSIFSLDVVTNNSGSLNPGEFQLSGSAIAGDDILVYRTSGSETFFADYFGACYSEFEIKIATEISWPTHNGDDASALFENNILIDSMTYNGSPLIVNEVYSSSHAYSDDPYEDSWAYRNDDGSWNFAGKDADVDGTASVYTSGAPYPLCPVTISGCTDSTAVNYNSDADDDDGSCVNLSNIPLSLQGVMDLYGSVPNNDDSIYFYDYNDGKALHLVASEDIPDLSEFGIGVANNGGGTDGVEWRFPSGSSANAGDDILVYRVGSADSSANFFADYFSDCFSEFEQKFTDASLTVLQQNGNDAVELFLDTIQIEVFGDVDSAMAGAPYEDSWAYKLSDGTWDFPGPDADEDDGTYSVYTSGAPYPLCAVTISGCTDLLAYNFNENATTDDGSCSFDSPLSLQGVMDLYGSTTGNGTLGYSGTDGKAIHLVATEAIADLSLFSIGVANGGGSDGPEYQLSGSANAGDDILVYRVGSADSSANFFADYFGACYAEFEVKIATGTNFPDGNGDDPIELFEGTYVVDSYGDVDSVMSGDPYEDSWAYRNVDGSWLEGGKDCDEDDNSYSVYSSGCPYPICNVQEIVGCTDTLAFNYNSFAQTSDSSCIAILEGCSDEDAENYNVDANTSCSSCCEYLGCTDLTALNYDENATQDDGSCVTDTASLTYALSLQGVLDLYGSGIDSLYSGSDGKAIHLVASADIADLSVFSLGVATNGQGSGGAEYHLSGSASAGDDILIYRVGTGPSSANFMSDYFGECFSEFEVTIADTSGFPDGNGDDPIELFENLAVIDSYGDVDGGAMLGDPYEDSWAYRNDDGSWLEGGEDCDQDDGTYTVAGSGCPYPICGIPIPGCTDSLYLEYYPAANSDDGSCSTLIVAGCTDALASNYNASANVDDNSCEYLNLTYALMIQGVMDLNGTPSSNDGKAIHLVATEDISDLSVFGLSVANNGGGTDGIEWTFPAATSAIAGDDILVYRVGTDPNFFANYFGACFSEFEHTFTDASLGSVLQQSGDDPMELFEDSVVIDMFGDVCCDMPGDPYNDSWAYRNADSTWTYGGQNCDDEVLELGADDQTYSVYTSGCPYPMCPPPPCNAPEDWGVTVTGSNHTIVIPDTVVVSLADGTVLSNAFVGVFFTDDNGDLICAGYEQANGSTVSIAAMGDDSTTDAVDGLVGSEEFVWIIADCNGNTFPASASYINGPEVFTSNGISSVLSLTEIPAGPSDQVLNFPSGWSMFSTYMVAADMNLINLLTPIISNVIIAKDYLGAAYLPEWNFNGIGELALGQGYQIKTEAADSITIVGDYAFPEDNPIDIVAGWNMIGYLRTESAAADAVLAAINATDNLIIAKNYLGAAYLPEWSFNGIGSMMPGQGYQIKVTNADVLQYLSNDQSYRMSTVKVTENHVAHYAKVAPTDNNMTVVIEDAAWDVLPSEGAEIAAFDKDGNLVGSAIYSSPVTVIAVWGDDATTASKDGLAVSEAVSFKVWNTNDVRDFTVSKWIEGSSTYQEDAINIASSIQTHTIMTELNTPVRLLVKVINVLGQEVNMDDEPFKGTVLFKVYDDGSVERFVE